MVAALDPGEEDRAPGERSAGDRAIGVLGESNPRLNFPEDRPGDFLEGTVLLLYTPLPVVTIAKAPDEGVPGLVDFLEFLDETERFLRISPYFRTLSVPALAFDAERPRAT